jgi:magnesium transporter
VLGGPGAKIRLVHCRVVDRTGPALLPLDREMLERKLEGGFFWLDVQDPSAEDLQLLEDVLVLHPLAVEDSREFGQRPKLDDYDTFSFMVLYGHAPDVDLLVEVHLYVSERALVTVRVDDSPALDALHGSYERRELKPDAAAMAHQIADVLVDSFFPALAVFDDRLDAVEDTLVSAPSDAQLSELFALRRSLARLRKVLGPQRDVIGRLASGTATLPAMTPEHERYFRDVYDHLLRFGEQGEATRDVISTAIEVYLSAQSNRMNAVMKQLTVIASIFLPLTFITGFFGQNFGWMVDHVGSWEAFVGLGIGAQLVGCALLLVIFRRRGWF